MTQPTLKSAAQPLVHHPSDALDSFGCYNDTSAPWVAFDEELTEQLRQLEEENRRYWTPKAIRRSIGR
jgi:hypothetical protein